MDLRQILKALEYGLLSTGHNLAIHQTKYQLFIDNLYLLHKMRKKSIYRMLCITAVAGFIACSDDEVGGQKFNPSSPIEITEFYPDSGGIATPMIIEGRNFGADTTGMKVYFEDVDGIKHPAGLVSSNGSRIYLFVPKGLTYKREMNLIVERTTSDGQTYSGKAEDQFIYRTQTSVSTVVGLASPDNNNLPTVGGDLATSTISSPFYLCLDDEDNIFITDRNGDSGQANQPATRCRNDKGEAVNGNILMASLSTNSVVVLKYGTTYINAPAFSDEEDNEAVYIPDDAGMKYYNMSKLLSYVPRYQAALKTPETGSIEEGNWKHCFVVNKNDHYIYTVMFKGQLVRINPRTRVAEILLTKMGQGTGNGSDTFITFSPIEGQEDMLYAAFASFNSIWRVNVRELDEADKDTYHGEPYAGKAILEGAEAGRGWEDGLLKNAKFNWPRQICFTDDGKLYIADSGNSCIRVIDTTMPIDKATVSTPIGLPGAHGYKDGGPEIAKFHFPCGVAVNSDGTIVYVADTQNKVIRKLSIE